MRWPLESIVLDPPGSSVLYDGHADLPRLVTTGNPGLPTKVLSLPTTETQRALAVAERKMQRVAFKALIQRQEAGAVR